MAEKCGKKVKNLEIQDQWSRCGIDSRGHDTSQCVVTVVAFLSQWRGGIRIEIESSSYVAIFLLLKGLGFGD